jgi:hypothetical protein
LLVAWVTRTEYVAVNQSCFSLVGHATSSIGWGYHPIAHIEFSTGTALVTLEHDVTSCPIQVECPPSDFPWLAPFLELYAQWQQDPVATVQPLLPVIVRGGRFVLSRAGAHHDYPETPEVQASGRALQSQTGLDLIWTRRKSRTKTQPSFILSLIRKATFRFG